MTSRMTFLKSGSSLALTSHFPHSGQFSKRLSDIQIITKHENAHINIQISSLVIVKCFSFENFSFVVHFTVDHRGVLFMSHPVYIILQPIQLENYLSTR